MTQANGAGKPLAISLMGPTASGKTDVAIALSEQIRTQIISVDSALVYRGMDIGSAKPSAEEQAKAPHKLIDICDPAEPYSVADFCRDAKSAIDDAVAQGFTPLLVGGTMMYFKALLEGLSDLPESDPLVRQQIDEEAKQRGWPHIHEQLAQVDPESAEKIHPNHSQRLSRALEVYRISGKPLSFFHGKPEGGLLDQYHWLQFAICPRDRAVLHDRIARRLEVMLQGGILQEVQVLRQRGDLTPDLPAIRAVGYRQAWEHLHGDYDEKEFVARATAATRQLAKRQLTWLRKWPEVNWLYTQTESGEFYTIEEITAQILKLIADRAIYW